MFDNVFFSEKSKRDNDEQIIKQFRETGIQHTDIETIGLKFQAAEETSEGEREQRKLKKL